jgi:hypothetical protein
MEEKGIYSRWAKIKEYRRRLSLIDPIIKNIYPDSILFIIFSIKLPNKYKVIINGFRITVVYNINKKIKILVDKEDSLKARTILESALTTCNTHSYSP